MKKEFLRFSPVSYAEFDSVYADLERAFPFEERRTYADEKKLLEEKNCRFYKVVFGNETVGCAVLWELKNFVFLEHITIKPEERGKGYGSETLRLMVKTYENKPIILEVEPPDGGYADRRIAFYQRNGFVLNEKADYVQPSYHGGEGIPLLIMSSQPLDETATEKFISEIKDFCYKTR